MDRFVAEPPRDDAPMIKASSRLAQARNTGHRAGSGRSRQPETLLAIRT